MIDLFEEFSRVVQALEANHLDYALCGGMALAVYGIPRATVDMDFLILPESVDDARRIAKDLGYTIEGEPMHFARGEVRIQCFVKFDQDSEDYLNLDFLLVTPVLQEVWADRISVEWEKGTLRVVGKSGLIRMKSLRGSGQDRDDIERLQE